MEYKKIEKNGRNLRVYEDSRVYVEPYSVKFKDGRIYHYKGKFRIPVNSRGYHCISFCNRIKKIHKAYKVHRLVAEAFLDDYSEKLQVDHIDGNKQNNHVSNLRMVTCKENLRGFRKKSKNSTSKYLGVHFDKRISEGYKQWFAKIKKNKIVYFIGYYSTEEEAALAYNQKAIELGFAPERVNVIDG